MCVLGGHISLPLPLSNFRSNRLIGGGGHEVAIEKSQRVNSRTFLIFSLNAKCQVNVRSKIKVESFALSAAKAELEAAANINLVKVLLKGWRRCHTNKGLVVNAGHG